MKIKVMLICFLIATAGWTFNPTIECRFSAIDEHGAISLDEYVLYTLDEATGIAGFFDPYGIEISTYGPELNVSIYLVEEPISGTRVLVRNILDMPLGTSIFGINTFFHESILGFISMQYECVKVG